jgi:chromosome segregation ATPase
VLAIVFGAAGFIAGLGGLFLGIRKDRRDDRAAAVASTDHLTALIVAQTENLLRGNEASVGELRERATELLVELRTCREERDNLRSRVDELERDRKSDRAELASIRVELAALRPGHRRQGDPSP